MGLVEDSPGLNVLHIATLSSGGAAESVRRIHRGLLSTGWNSRILFATPDGIEPPREEVFPRGVGRILHRFRQRFDRSNPLSRHKCAVRGADLAADEAFTSPVTGIRVDHTEAYRSADVVHLHWTGNLLDWPSFFSENKKPVVWSLCDFNPLTGGCHYPGGCGSFAETSGCRDCPVLTDASDPDRAEVSFQAKKEAERRRDFPLVFLPPTEWMAEQVERSSLFSRARSVVLPHLGDEGIYRAQDRAASRAGLGLPTDEPLLLFVGDHVSRRKGFGLLREALDVLGDSAPRLVLVGSIPEDAIPARAVSFGRVSDPARLAALYASSDVIAIPSLEENLALTFVDSQCCGTPAVVFPVGGLRESVEPGRNGIVADEVSSSALAEAIQAAFRVETEWDNSAIAAQARDRYCWSGIGHRYEAIYRDLPTDSCP